MIDLIIPPDTVRVSKSKVSTQIFSQIYFQIENNIFFPEENWDDFTAAILNFWIEEACRVGRHYMANCRFMDGPFYFNIYYVNQICNIRFIDDTYGKREIIFSGEIDYCYLLNLLKRNANLVIRNLPKEAFKLNDVIELQKNLELIQKMIKKLKKSNSK